ncbi:hypothetical protein LJR074_003410 [Acidovorax sp. LjRoot74]|uniref:hypothetical protein n=1 Tax=Acidovorax sp. LjRoot74 TaxID=3342337 RepID=UPI003ECC7DDE
MTKQPTPIDLSGLSEQALSAIESEAKRRCVSFDDACLQMLVEHSRQLQRRARLNPLARLFRFPSANQK